jgi:hypothetical protein
MDYTNDLKPALLPPWIQLPDGTWERRWEVAFLTAPSDDRLRGLPDLSEGGFEVRVARNEGAVQITTTVVADPLSDDHFVWAPRRVLRRLEALLGPMVSINGLPREWFAPH